VQRELSVGDLSGVRKSLLVNAFGRFPVVLLYCVMGVLVGAVFTFPENIAAIASKMQIDPATASETLKSDPDRMVPMFILTFLPAGVVGLIFVAILSALMSSLDSAINSLSAATMQDFYKPYVKSEASDRHYLIVSKTLTVLWGGFCVIVALAFAQAGETTRQTTIVTINAIGSLLYGPILAAFLMGMLSRRVLPTGMKAGVLFGISINIVLWLATPISWLWWNLTGFVSAILASLITSHLWEPARLKLVTNGLLHDQGKGHRRWGPTAYAVIAYLAAIIIASYTIQSIA
jgi:SSS family solute:Na+ symporter